MYSTPQQLHNAFLDGIRKSATTTVKPSVFCRIWNEWAMLEWVKGNTSMREGIELTQKQIDDLRMLYVRSSIHPLFGTKVPLPDGITAIGHDLMDPRDNPSIMEVLPKYLRALKVRWIITYDSNVCGKTGNSTLLKSKYMRADEEGVITESVYRKPADHRLYHKIVGDYILFIGGYSQPYLCYLDYIRYPNEMSCTSEVLSYTIDLYPEQLSEVLSLAVKIYLERVSDPRYKSFLNEEMIRQTSQI